jgi:hypothetical protein
VKLANPNRFLTLTCRRKDNQTPRQAFDHSRRQVSELAKKARNEGNEFEFFRVLENTKAGWPHYHLLLRSPFIRHEQLRGWWRLLTGHEIVDIRKINDQRDATDYVFKYVVKQREIAYTSRRISWSRHFFPPAEKPPPLETEFTGWSRAAGKTIDEAINEIGHKELIPISPTHFVAIYTELEFPL